MLEAKIAGLVVLLLLAGGAVYHYKSLVADREKLEQAETVISGLQDEKAATAAAFAAEKERRRQGEEDLAKAEESARARNAIFEGQDFNALFQAKHSLIVRAGNRATDSVFKRLETAANKHANSVRASEAQGNTPEEGGVEGRSE